MELSKKQKEIINAKENKITVVAAAGSGKALENGSIVYCDSGPKKIEDSKIGDLIYCEDGKLHKITGVFPQGKKKKYIITLTDGTKISCCDEHIWTFQTEYQHDKEPKNYTTMTLREIIDKDMLFSRRGNDQKKYKNIWLPITKPVEFSKKELPLHPYLFGALLENGTLKGIEEKFCFNSNDSDVITKVNEYLSLINSENKFIPNIYKYSNIEDRIHLLKGIIDTNGCYANECYSIIFKSKQLILDIQEMCESLGLTAKYQEKEVICTNSSNDEKDYETIYKLCIKQSKLINKIHSSKKIEEQWKITNTYASRAFDSIEETDEFVEMTCITVDNPTHLFLTDHFIVTHNTACLTERVKKLLKDGVKASEIVVITFTTLASEEMRLRIGEAGKGCFIGTVHSYCNFLLSCKGYDTRKYLDKEEFDELFSMIKRHPDCVQHVSHLLLDEAQDSTDEQFEFILNMIKPDNYFIVFDHRQSIYSFLNANPDYTYDLSRQEGVTRYELTENYRCAPQILSYAKEFLDPLGYKYFDDSIAMSKEHGSIYRIEFSPEKIGNFILESEDQFGDWFVLARTNDDVKLIGEVLTDLGIPCDIIKKAEFSNAELKEKMKENTVKIMTMHQSKGLESPCVVVAGAKYYNDEERRLDYVAATRAKRLLVWCTIPQNKKKKKQKVIIWD